MEEFNQKVYGALKGVLPENKVVLYGASLLVGILLSQLPGLFFLLMVVIGGYVAFAFGSIIAVKQYPNVPAASPVVAASPIAGEGKEFEIKTQQQKEARLAYGLAIAAPALLVIALF